MKYLKLLLLFLIKCVFRTCFNIVKYSIIFCIFYSLPYLYKNVYLYPMLSLNVVKLTYWGGGHGTGFFYEYKGKQYLVSNHHVCDNQKYLYFTYNNKKYTVSPKAYDVDNDLCLIDIGLSNFPLIGTLDVYRDQEILSTGYMYDTNKHILTGRINQKDIVWSNGFRVKNDYDVKKCHSRNHRRVKRTFNNLVYCQQEKSVVHTSVMIAPGHSGSPAINYMGNVIGVFATHDIRTKFGSYIPIKYVNELIERTLK